jgi:hypothetical protein
MSDITAKVVSDSSIRELDSKGKIAALKEKLAHDNTGIVINGTNGKSNHSNNPKKLMSKPDNIVNVKLANGVNSEVDNGISSRNSEKSSNISSALQQHTNGKISKGVLPVKTDQKVLDIDGKLSLPAGMSVTPLGKCFNLLQIAASFLSVNFLTNNFLHNKNYNF